MVTKEDFRGLGILSRDVLISALVQYSKNDLNPARLDKVNELINALSY